MRSHLKTAARGIAAIYDKPIANPFQACRKLLIAPRWIAHGVRAKGLRRWKHGELIEVLTANSPAERRKEWGDVGYYIAQTWSWLWFLYETVTPAHIIESAVTKFERRAQSYQEA